VRGYLGAIGFTALPEDLVPARPIRRAPRRWPDDHAALIAVPTSTIKTAIREIAAKARTAPHVVWSWRISSFIWTHRVVLQDDLKKRTARTPMAGSSLVERVGREAS
jgi:hypothetical protein